MKKEQIIIEFLNKNINNIVAIYIFGSYAAKNMTKESDIDIAYLSKNKNSPSKNFNLAGKLSLLLNMDVDLVELDSASTVMQFEIIRKGIRIFCKDLKEAEFFADKTYFLYLQLCEERAGILHDIKQRGSVYG